MTLRRTFLAAIATSVLFAGPALADGAHKHGLILPGSSSSNVVQSQNTAAGIGNHAAQGVTVFQSGKSGPSWHTQGFSSNQVFSDNTAAGIGNRANQGVAVMQQGTHGTFSSFNAVSSQNLAAGIRNHANQNVFVQQK